MHPETSLTKCKAALRLIFGLHQFDCQAEILFADSGLLPVSALISAAKLCWKVRLFNMSAERFPVAVDSITIPGQTDAACKKGEDFNAHINTICNDVHTFYGMKIVTHTPAQRPTRHSARRRSNRNATVDDQTDVIPFCAPGFRTQLQVTTSLSTGGGPVICVQLSEAGFQVVHPPGLWSRFSRVVKIQFGYGY